MSRLTLDRIKESSIFTLGAERPGIGEDKTSGFLPGFDLKDNEL